MYVYFNNEGVLKTIIPHGEPVRQGSNLNLYVCLETDFFTSKNENIDDWTVNVELTFPNEKTGTTKLLTTKADNIPETIVFQKTNDSEVTFDLKNNEYYLCYQFSFTPELSTIYAGTLIASISLIKTNTVDGVIVAQDTKYFGNANIFVEKTFGYGKRVVDESSLHYKNLVDQINDLNIKKASKTWVQGKLDLKEDKANKVQAIDTENPSEEKYPSEKASSDALKKLENTIDEKYVDVEYQTNKVPTINKDNPNDNNYPTEKAVVDYVETQFADIDEKIKENVEEVVKDATKDKEDKSNKTQTINLENPNEEKYPSEKAVAYEINNIDSKIDGKFVPVTRKVAGYELKNDITAEQIYSALALGTAAKKNAGNLADQLPIIGSDGKLPLSIIPIGTGMFYGGSISYDHNANALVPSKEFVKVFGGTEGVEIDVNVTDDYSPAYFIVSESGTILGLECVVGDWIVCNGANNYVRIDNVDAVISVNGLTGLVVLNSSNVKINSFILGTSDGDIIDGDTINEALSKVQNKNKVNLINLPDQYISLTSEELVDILNKLKTDKLNVLHYSTGNSYVDYIVSDYSKTETYMIILDVQASTIKIVEIELDAETNDVVYFIKEIGTGDDLVFDNPAQATQGTLTEEQLTKLQFNEDCKIVFNNEVYRLEDKGHVEGYLTYTHNGYDNSEHWQKCITITISTRAWVLNSIKVASKEYVEEYVGSHSSSVDSKELVKAVTTLGEPTKNDPYIVFKDEEVYRRNSVTDANTPILYPPIKGYHTYYIVKSDYSNNYYIIWSTKDDLIITKGGYASSSMAEARIIVFMQPWHYFTTATSEIDAINKIKSSSTIYTIQNPDEPDEPDTVIIYLASQSDSSGTYPSASVRINNPIVKSSVSSKTYIDFVSYWYSASGSQNSNTTATQTGITQIEGYFSDEVPTNSYKKLVTKEEVDTKLDKVTTTTSLTQAYVKNEDGTQGMLPIALSARGGSIVQRTAEGRLQASTGESYYDVVNKMQLDSAIAGIVPYHIEVTGTSGTITENQYILLEDANSYIIKDGNVFRYYTHSDTTMRFTNVSGNISYTLTITKSTLSWTLGTTTLETQANKTKTLSSSSTDTQYPTAKAVVDYVNSKAGQTYTAGDGIKIENNVISLDIANFTGGEF